MPRQKKPTPASQDALDSIQDDYQTALVPIADAFFEARRTCDNAACARLWDYAKVLMARKHASMIAALNGAA